MPLSQKRWFMISAGVSFVASVMVFSAIPSYAQSSSEPSKQMTQFLSFDRSAQDGFMGNGIMMIATIAAQTEPEIAKCIDEWYSQSESVSAKRHDEILNVMQTYRQYTPAAIVLAVVEKNCGKFRRAD